MAEPGGLARHSLNVYYRLKWLVDVTASSSPDFAKPSDETIAVAALLHDLCKVGCYTREYKNKKIYDAEKVNAAPQSQVKRDDNGLYFWDSVPSYKFNDPMPYGHGEKSVYIITAFMKLSREEAFAIRFHMGSWNDGEKSNAGKAFEMYPLAFLLHTADEFATFIDEKE